MNDRLNEQISALVDGELPEAEQLLLTKQLGKDAGLRGRLSRYQLISDAMQERLPAYIETGFSARVSAAIENEQVVTARTAPGKRLYGNIARLAVAASVAVVAVFSLQTVRETSTGGQEIATAPAAEDYIRAPEQSAPPPANIARTPSRNLDVYLVNHNEFAASRGMLPYVRLVGQTGSVEKE